MESLLGIKREANRLRIVPCLPKAWKTYAISYRVGQAVYMIKVIQDSINTIASGQTLASVTSVILDGIKQSEESFELIDDAKEHSVQIHLSTQS